MDEKVKEPWLYPSCMFCGKILTRYAYLHDNRFMCVNCAKDAMLVWIPDWMKKQEVK